MASIVGIGEDQLKRWATAPSETEETKCQNAVTQIERALKDRFGANITMFLQGSYKNRTNVRKDSDVDIVVRYDMVYFPDLSFLSEQEKATYKALYTDADYKFGQFKTDVHNVLTSVFSSSEVERKDKCIKVKGNTYRVNADVVPCFVHKRFKSPHATSAEGIQFFTDSSKKVIGFPEQHYQNGTSKNVNTNRMYKSIVRILKNVRNELVDQGGIDKDLMSSFFLECLVWNVPNNEFSSSTYYQATRNIIVRIYNDMKKEELYLKYTEVSDLKWLFKGNNDRSPAQASKFMQAAYNYMGYS